ncbi:exosome catalytic subunit DIS3 [Sporobolomyces salmoneus]|uniref:exosome catalytic subunit DIS3 n=1 Tax=Sporobolomyces salmoneus TaxID=183962 RepID=UPI00318248A0
MSESTPSSITILRKRPAGQGGASSTSFFRKTARGKLQRVIREHYLRPASDFQSPPTLPEGVQWILPDTNAILHQFDFISSQDFPAPLLVAQTVLDEVRHRSLPLYNKLRTLIDEDLELEDGKGMIKRGFTVWNEAIEETFLEKEPGESPNDRNDRAIRHLASYYTSLLSSSSSSSSNKRQKTSSSTSSTPSTASAPLVLLTDDQANLSLAHLASIPSLSIRQYLSTLPSSTQSKLVDLLAVDGIGLDRDGKGGKGGGGGGKRKALYEEYLPTSVLNAGVKAGKLFQGHFNPSQYNFREATVNVPGRDKPILLSGLESMNRSVAGDLVVVELLPESQWKSIGEEVVDSDQQKQDDPDSLPTSDEATSSAPSGDASIVPTPQTLSTREIQPTGKVVGITRRAFRPYVCTLDLSSLPPSALTSSTSTTILASPVSRQIPRIRILTRQAAHLSSQKFLVSIDRWSINSRYPEGHFVRVLGSVGSKEGEVESLLEEWEIPYRPFSSSILSCLPIEGEGWRVPSKEDDPKGIWNGREDLREEIVCSIDPPGCQDIDDALHAKRLPNGNIQAGVHIADVSHFVLPDNPMDTEAASRGTTVYLVDKRIDMLPHLLGTNLCSLRPYVERLAFSVIWELNENADIVNVRFTKSVIASKEAFTYEAAQRRKDDKSKTDSLTEGIRLLNTLALQLRAKRMAAGALNLASPEVKIHLESSESTGPIDAPVDVETKELFETNSLVEEFMLLANISVAERIQKQFPQTAVLRRHAPPPKTNFEVLQDVLQKRRDMTLDVSSSGALAASLDECVDPSFPSFNTLVRIMATRCMLSAEYFCSGSIPSSQFSHYGLASPIYTHFTSPIRRYADVLVHRQLAAAISSQPLSIGLQTRSWVDKTLEVVNKRHRSAQQAARASIEFYVALAIQRREERAKEAVGGAQKVRAEAFVIRAFRNGVAVFVNQFGLEGLVTFKRDNEYDAETYEITIPDREGKKHKIGVFDKVVVEIGVEKDKNTQRGKVVMALVEPVDSRAL